MTALHFKILIIIDQNTTIIKNAGNKVNGSVRTPETAPSSNYKITSQGTNGNIDTNYKQGGITYLVPENYTNGKLINVTVNPISIIKKK